jgi:hypothetical protein
MGPTQDQTFCTGDTVEQHGVLHRVNPQRMQKHQLHFVCGRERMSEEANLSATTVGLMKLHGNRA